MSTTRTLTGNSDHERRIHLERYLEIWLRSHALTIGDLAKESVRTRLLGTLSADLGTILGKSVDAVAGYIGMRVMRAGSEALQKGVSKLLDWGKTRSST